MQLLRSQTYLKFSRRRETRKVNTTLETGSDLVGNRGDKEQKKSFIGSWCLVWVLKDVRSASDKPDWGGVWVAFHTERTEQPKTIRHWSTWFVLENWRVLLSGMWNARDVEQGVARKWCHRSHDAPVFPNDMLCPYLLGSGYPVNAPWTLLSVGRGWWEVSEGEGMLLH